MHRSVHRLLGQHGVLRSSLCHPRGGVLSVRPASSAADGKLVDVSVNDQTGVATVTMQRPPVNSLNLDMLQQLTNTFEKLEEDRSRGVILTSALPTVFCAGLEITEMYQGEAERQRVFWTAFQDTWLSLYGASYPTVAAINGHAPAGGCLLSLTCDYRVMVGPQYNIGLNETQLGIVAPKWVMEMMLRAIPRRKAELALVNGLMFKAEEALQLGLVDKLAVDKADAIACAEQFLAAQAKVPRAARGLTKMSLHNDIVEWLQQNKDQDRETFLGFVTQPEQQAIMGQYLEALKHKKKTK